MFFSCGTGVVLIAAGVVWWVVPGLPLGGWPTGASLILSGLILLGVLVVVNRAGFHRWPVYAILGLAVWLAVLKSGIHATAAGVLVSLVVPARPA